MGKTVMGAVVSLDGFIADDADWEHAGPLADPVLFENPTHVVPGDRVTHLVFDVSKA